MSVFFGSESRLYTAKGVVACALRAHLFALLGYLLLSSIALWDVLKSPFTNVVGVPHLHVWEELWHFWWTGIAMTSGESPFFSNMLGFPSGMNVFYDMSSISLPLVSVPLQSLFGVVGAYNAIALLSLTAAAFGSYLVCRRVSGNRLAAFLGGTVFGLSPFLQTELSNGMMENVFAFALLPYFVLCLLRIHAGGRWTNGLAAGLIAGFATLSSWYFVVACAFLSPLFLYSEGYERDARATHPVRVLKGYAVMAAVIALIIIVPLTALTSGPTLQRGVPWKDCVRGPIMQKSCIDVLKLFSHSGSPSSGQPAVAPGDEAIELLPFGVYVGKIVILFALAALCMRDPEHEPGNDDTCVADDARIDRKRRGPAFAFWGAGFILFLLLMLGPYLNVGGRVDWGPVRIPMLNRILLLLPGTGRVLALHNYRFVSCAMLFAAVLASLSLRRMVARFGPRFRLFLTAFATWLIVVDFGNSTAREHLLFLPVSDSTPPAVYEAIAGEPAGAIFNIPVSSGAHFRPDIRGVQMFHQLTHRRPIPCDPIYILDPPENEISLARAARAMAGNMEWQLDGNVLNRDIDLLVEQGFRFVVVFRNFLATNDHNRISRLIQDRLGPPVATDGDIEIYQL